jgi:hypothetical protein
MATLRRSRHDCPEQAERLLLGGHSILLVQPNPRIEKPNRDAPLWTGGLCAVSTNTAQASKPLPRTAGYRWR